MKRKICYILNPISGTGSKDMLSNVVAKETLKAGIAFQFFPSVASGDYSFLFDTITEERYTDVVIIGGDGTVNQVIDSLKHLPVRFGIIPSGSGNGLAFGAGIPKTPVKALKVIFKNRWMPVDGFRVNGKFACMLCGLGFDAKVAHDFANAPQRGLMTYVNQVFKNFFGAKPYLFKIKLAETQFETGAYFISIANSNQFGNHFTIAPKASLNDGLLDVVIVTEQSKMAMLYNTLIQIGGMNKVQAVEAVRKKRGIIYFQTSSIRISNRNEAPMHIDGEPVATEKKLNIEIEKSCFNLLSDYL
ncbi:diacylglycerol kinase [Niabella ginsenosidivorans]|uniref:diacylglycerol kinase (ATP) n=1 Tax=Niabella ginsenosidivorans TaxID=1176587 RepID=A0A1A9I573_9BACT|nr:YegS/Rv2252/BmrU family lipid kinase [Niabella ginsenosidivorans]ANH82828.1 diacylglycerol kinase [Niabella ginsenosidivorans]